MSDDLNQDAISALLDQGGIDQLMAEAKKVEDELIIFDKTGVRIDSRLKRAQVEAYDFRNPIFLTEVELRQIRIRHEKFAHYLAARLSMFLRMDFDIKLAKLYTLAYNSFTEMIPNPIFISLFKVDPMEGVGILSINPRLALTVVNRMLGGQGHSVHDERYLTEIEIVLMEDVVQIFLDEWLKQWDQISEKELSTHLIGSENNGRFLETAQQDAIMMVFDLQATLGDCSETIQMGVPYYMIEPLVKEMQANSKKYVQQSNGGKNKEWVTSYSKINVPVAAEWDCFDLSVIDVLALKAGDMLTLPKDIVKNTFLRFKNSTHFVGELGLEAGRLVVKVDHKLE